MARVFVRLKLRLLVAGLRTGGPARIGFVLGALVSLVGGAVGLVGLSALHGHGRLAADAGVTAFSALALGWVTLPLLAFGGSDETLDPSRLALLPLTRRQLVVGLGAASCVSLTVLATTAIALGAVIGMAATPAAALVGVVALVLEVALCLVLSRAVTTSLAGVMRSRRGRDLAVLVTAAAVAGSQLLNVAVQAGVAGRLSAPFHHIARVLQWTPPGWAATAVSAAARGRWLLAAGALVGCAAVVLLAGAAWAAALVRSLETVDASSQPRRSRRRQQQPADARTRRHLLPAGRLGAVTRRELRYAWRDPRRKVGWASSLALGLVWPLVLAVNGGGLPRYGAFSACLVAFTSSMSQANGIGMDGEATWLQIATSPTVRELRTDLAGKQLGTALIGGPFVLVLALVVGLLTDARLYAVEAVGLAGALLGAGIAGSTLTSVIAPYPVPERVNVFGGGGAGAGCLSGVVVLGSMVATVVACAPLVVLLVVGRTSPVVAVAMLVLGPGEGLLLAWLARRWAAGWLFPDLDQLLPRIVPARAA